MHVVRSCMCASISRAYRVKLNELLSWVSRTKALIRLRKPEPRLLSGLAGRRKNFAKPVVKAEALPQVNPACQPTYFTGWGKLRSISIFFLRASVLYNKSRYSRNRP